MGFLSRLRAWLPTILALAGALLVTSLALLAGGHSPARAFTALVQGAVGSPDQFFSITLVRATPLILTGLAVALAFRGGVWNIGAEGQLYAGALAVVTVAALQPALPRALGVVGVLVLGTVAGGLCAVVPAWLRSRSGTSEVITTLLMNFLMLHFASLLVRGPLQEARGVFPQTDPIGDALRLPTLGWGTRLHLGFFLALLCALALSIVWRRTRVGLRIRALGASRGAAELVGRIDPDRYSGWLLIASGCLAGLAGAVEVTGVTFAMYEDLSPGWGYTAIAVALLGGLRPMGVVAAGILLGGLEGGAGAMQRGADVPAVWVVGIEALLILAAILAISWQPARARAD